MTTERKKALLMMGVTFVIGVLIGVLGTGFFARNFYHGRRPMDKKEMSGRKRGDFVGKIFRVVDADSLQKKAIRPILEETMTRIDTMQAKGEKAAKAALDSMKVKLDLILRPEQIERLDKFTSRIRGSGGERQNRGREHKQGE